MAGPEVDGPHRVAWRRRRATRWCSRAVPSLRRPTHRTRGGRPHAPGAGADRARLPPGRHAAAAGPSGPPTSTATCSSPSSWSDDAVLLTWRFGLGEFMLDRGWQIGGAESASQELYPQRDVRLPADAPTRSPPRSAARSASCSSTSGTPNCERGREARPDVRRIPARWDWSTGAGPAGACAPACSCSAGWCWWRGSGCRCWAAGFDLGTLGGLRRPRAGGAVRGRAGRGRWRRAARHAAGRRARRAAGQPRRRAAADPPRPRGVRRMHDTTATTR